MVAARRKGPRKRQHSSSQTLARAASVAVVIFVMCLCAFNFDLNDGESTTITHPRLEKCRLTCDRRLQSAALDSHVPSSGSPSAADALFQIREAESRSASPTEGDGGHAGKQPAQTRPRRLPALIKVLTGFGDEPESEGDPGHKPIIARIERPDFIPPGPRRGNEPSSHEETVQMAAAAAAAAVFSRSMRIFGNNRMHRVNSEWDAALRWIAGWDQSQQGNPLGGDGSEPPVRANDGGSASGGASGSASREGYDNFVDDLARMLESCISQCVEDEHFETRMDEGEGVPAEAKAGLSIGNIILKSIFGWIVASSFPRISFGKLDMLSSESMLILTRTVQVVLYSSVAYSLHSLWGLASPVLFQWYSSLGYTESPEWLLQHEKEIQQTKASRSRQQKKKLRRKQSVKQASNRNEATLRNDVIQEESCADKTTSGEVDLEPCRSSGSVKPATVSVKVAGKASGSFDALVNKGKETGSSDAGALHLTAEITVPDSKDSVSDSQDSSGDIPSIISYSSTSASSSPSLKPIGHLEDRDIPFGATLQAAPQPVLGLSAQFGRQSPLFSQFGRQSPLFSQLTHSKAPPVPTQEQRNEAARQLREFQNAQIQRLLLQRKLSQISSGSRLSTSSPLGCGLISGHSFHYAGSAASTVSGQGIKVLRPPPGLTHPSEVPSNADLQKQDDKSFFTTDNELFLSKLLDDDEEDIVEVPTSLHTKSMSPESSLDPSAAPFISSGNAGSTQSEKCPFPKAKHEKVDGWKSNPSELLRGNGSVRIKGVYGGSVW